MASDQIVTPIGKQPTPDVGEGAGPAPLPAGLRFLMSAVGWVVGAFTLIGAASVFYIAPDYPPTLVEAALLLVAGLTVLPPALGAARRAVPGASLRWMPPLLYLLLVFSAGPLSKLVEPHGAAREVYVAKSLTAADRALRANDPGEADRRMSMITADAANRQVKTMMARIEAARAAQLAAAGAAARPPPPVDPTLAKPPGRGGRRHDRRSG